MFSEHYRLLWSSNVHLVSWVYMRVGYVFEPRFFIGKNFSISIISGILDKEFLVGIIKNV